MTKEDGFTVEEKGKTLRELLRDNDWVFKNPILMSIINDAPSAIQADERVKKMFPALPAVNKIAKAVRRLTHLCVTSKENIWKALSKPDSDYRPVDMFVFPEIPDLRDERLVFSSGINFYPPGGNSGLFEYGDLPDIFREVTDGMHTSISLLHAENSVAKIKTVDPKDLTVPDDDIKMHREGRTKVGKFNVSPKEFAYPTSCPQETAYAMHYNYPDNEIGISNQVVIVSPGKGDIYSTIYRKISICQDLGLYDPDPLGYADSIVVLLDMGIAVKNDSRESIGKVIFRRKHFWDEKHDFPITLTFEYTISPSLKLVPLYKKSNTPLVGYIQFDYKYPNLPMNPDINQCKVAGIITTDLGSYEKPSTSKNMI